MISKSINSILIELKITQLQFKVKVTWACRGKFTKLV